MLRHVGRRHQAAARAVEVAEGARDTQPGPEPRHTLPAVDARWLELVAQVRRLHVAARALDARLLRRQVALVVGGERESVQVAVDARAVAGAARANNRTAIAAARDVQRDTAGGGVAAGIHNEGARARLA